MGKVLSPDEQARVVEALRKLLDERYGGNQSAFVRAHPMNQSYVSKLLRGEAAPGWGFARKLARITGTTAETLVSGQQTPALGPRFCDIPGWAEVERQAIELEPTLADMIRKVATWYTPEPIASISPDRVIEAAFWMKRTLARR